MSVPAIKSVMTQAPVTVHLSDTVQAAQRLMSDRRIRHLPVMDKDRPVAVISDRDINLALLATHGLASEALTVEEVCTLATYTVDADTPLDQVVLNMAERHIGSVLVTEGGTLAGIFTTTDACRYLGLCIQGKLIGL